MCGDQSRCNTRTWWETWDVSCAASRPVRPTAPVDSRGSGASVRNTSRDCSGHTKTSAMTPRPISRCRPPPQLTSPLPSRRRLPKVSGASPSSTVRDPVRGPLPSPSLSSAVGLHHVPSSPSSNIIIITVISGTCRAPIAERSKYRTVPKNKKNE